MTQVSLLVPKSAIRSPSHPGITAVLIKVASKYDAFISDRGKHPIIKIMWWAGDASPSQLLTETRAVFRLFAAANHARS